MKITEYIYSTERIPEREIKAALESSIIEELGALRIAQIYLQDRMSYIPSSIEISNALTRFYLLCLETNPPSTDYALSRYEAARELQAMLKEWQAQRPLPTQEMRSLADSIREMYLRGDRALKTAIETGFLEHVFEEESLIPLFQSWQNDKNLSEAFQFAQEWAGDHQR